jgi:SAM-dependent methyltransferase
MIRKVWRAIPRKVKGDLRLLYMRLLDHRDRMLGRGSAQEPPRSLRDRVGGGDFRAIGQAYVERFRTVCGLAPDESVLDIGCGVGRMALPLLDYLDESGSYIGFDISRSAIAWCREHITSRNPRYSFHLADIRNAEYNPDGRLSAVEYAFPCGDQSVDFAFATSVFTHMQAAEVRHYLSELRRALKPRGRAMLTFFLLGEEARRRMRAGAASLRFDVELDGCFTIDAQVPESAIAFTERQLGDLLRSSGLKLISAVIPGSWSGETGASDFQDAAVVGRV